MGTKDIMITKIRIDGKMEIQARKMEAKARKMWPSSTKNGNYLIGYKGEYAIEQLLLDNNVRYRYTPRIDGHPDDGDFIVWIEGKPARVDVKTTVNDNVWMLVNKNAKKFDYYIGVKVVDREAEIWGYATHDMLTDETGVAGTIGETLGLLTNIDEFIRMVDKI